MDNSLVIVVVLLFTVMLRIGLIGGLVWLLISRRLHCPHCGERTERLLLPAWLDAIRIERRWCLGCGWNGLAKRDGATAGASQHSTTIAPFGIVLAVAAQGCAAQDRVPAVFESDAAWVDLTYPFNDSTVYWPTSARFELEVVTAGLTPGGYYYAANNFRGAEHGGTHLDAPVHFAEGRHTTDEIPLARLIGPAVVIDVSQRASADPDFRVDVSDLLSFEMAHGRIPDGAIMLVRTGWGSRWPDPAAYLGTELRGPAAVPQLHFPGIAPGAARWLADERSIDAVGIDTPSIDFGQSTDFETHRILFAANIPAFENVANLEALPETGAYVIALPMKIEGGSGGPLRIVGVVPEM